MNEKSHTPASFADTIREARHQHGWSQETLAEQAGVSRPTIARVEAGNDISTATLAKIAEALGLTFKMESI
ncbi:helix-turn-helix domain-containing protein [Arthrobacter sulfonylureivorans]|uniref:Helix-turn-helix transcriptional regulator n=1 Tax=Arthrobacter sulfonylureivorans TaxID=2486855 RepID=A0ABY3WBS4_9MICC|nr:helix-turn-helix transcriptional regulator [Arthrobacter sulfonylureivorans]UNK47803.1 helix-turn-helix transcriptional regulator [Arthrobacter sulfonylureivorans]